MGRPGLTAVLLSMRYSCSTFEDAFRFEIDTHFVTTEVFSIDPQASGPSPTTRQDKSTRSSRPGPRRHLALAEKQTEGLLHP